MKQLDDLVWHSESNKRFRRLMLLAIRFVETCMASIIPSFIGLMLVLLNPNGRIMTIMCFLSYAIFCVVNWRFWMKFLKQRTSRTEFLTVNIAAYGIYAVISVLFYKFTGHFLYSVVFSNLRAFEAFGMVTSHSLVASHIFILVLMAVCVWVTPMYYKNVLRKLAQNGADEIEMDLWGHLKPERNGDNVRMLSVDEMCEEMEKEQSQRVEVDSVNTAENLWDGEMTKGRGERIVYEDADEVTELQESDFADDYEPDNLWNRSIYCDGGEPITDYDEPDELPDFFTVNHYEGEENDGLWDGMYRGRDENDRPHTDDDVYADGEDDGNAFADYDTDNLWDNVRQGKATPDGE